MEEVKYVINYWYDDRNEKSPYSFVLIDSDTFTGEVGEIIDKVDDIKSGLYFRANDNLPLILVKKEADNVINIYYTRAYRNYMYTMAKQAITDSLVTPDVDVFLKLLGVSYGDLYNISKNVDDAINLEYVDEDHLRHLCYLIGYKWVEALTAEEQRESIKFYMHLRRMRGTSFGLKNLIRIFGQTTSTLYQVSNNKGVRVFEYREGNKYGMFPGDIRIEIPELSDILREAANDVKLMGTRLIFAYRIDIGTTNEDAYGHMLGYYPAPAVTSKIRTWIQPGLKGWDVQQTHALYGTNYITQKEINHLAEAIDAVEVQDISNETKSHTIEHNLLRIVGDNMPNIVNDYSRKLIYKYRDTYNLHSSTDIIINHSEPFVNMWIFQEKGLQNIRGVLTEDGIINENLYLYK